MNRKPVLSRQPLGVSVTAAAFSILIGMTLPAAVADLFVNEGTLFQYAAASERGCDTPELESHHTHCVQSPVAPWAARTVASR